MENLCNIIFKESKSKKNFSFTINCCGWYCKTFCYWIEKIFIIEFMVLVLKTFIIPCKLLRLRKVFVLL